MNAIMKLQSPKQANKYVTEQNERLPTIMYIIQNPVEYIDDAQLVTGVSMLYRADY